MKIFTTRQPRITRGGPRRAAARLQAFTFVEVMIATVITVVMFVTFYSAINSGILIIRNARERVRATQILLNRMEGIRLMTFNQVANPSLMPTNFTEVYYPNSTDGNPGITYTGAVSVVTAALTSPASSYSSNLYKVTVRLDWKSVGTVQTKTISTYTGKYGIQNYVWSH